VVKKRIIEPISPPKLVVPRAGAAQRIKAQIEKGHEIRNLVINSEGDFERARAERSKWSQYNTELLTRLFDNQSIALEYNRVGLRALVINPSFAQRVKDLNECIDNSINQLESILDRLELIPELGELQEPSIALNKSVSLGNDIFIVHGRDGAAKESVARFIEKLDLHPVILHEQPNAGRTIIEKFEDYSNVGFTIVLLTPDDIGAPQDRPEEGKLRARQNVILELGYFLGKLGRSRVCVLYKEDVEIPSDYRGVLYVPMDGGGGWRILLAKEIKQAGIEFDLNKAL
jgi:predicted nucleotide-binding protein